MDDGPALNRQGMRALWSPSKRRCPDFALLSRSAAKLWKSIRHLLMQWIGMIRTQG
jgi:hypothetical protein